MASHPLENYNYWRKGHKKTKNNRHWNERALVSQMEVGSNAEGVNTNSEGVDGNYEVVDSNAHSQTILSLPPFDYCVGRYDLSQFLHDPITDDERLS